MAMAMALVVWEGIVLVVGMVWQGHGDLVVIILQKLADPTFQ